MKVEELFRQRLRDIPGFETRRYLVAVSGGPDSMVLAHLMRQSGLPFALAHCQYGLRGAESEADARLVRDYARRYALELFEEHCPVAPGKNVQLEARRLRYAFFERVMKARGIDILLTAHHADDRAETFFVNLLRGTGLKGLTGIPQGPVVFRPLIDLSKRELESYAVARRIPFRTDRSNLSDKYLRNRIRHRLLPMLEEWKPGFVPRLNRTMDILQAHLELSRHWFGQLSDRILQSSGPHGTLLPLKDLPAPPLDDLFLYLWLSDLDFTDMRAVVGLKNAGVSARVYNKAQTLFVERLPDALFLGKTGTGAYRTYRYDSLEEMIDSFPLARMRRMTAGEARDQDYVHSPPHTAYVDAGLLEPPFEWRPWRPGDRFRPLGMQGSKKVGDFLTDRKIPVYRRQGIYLFLSRGRPVWLAGYRLDGRFALTGQTEQVLKITWKGED